MIRLNNLFKKQSNKPEAPQHNDDVEDGQLSRDDDDNAAPSESTVIIEDEPQKKVNTKTNTKTNTKIQTNENI